MYVLISFLFLAETKKITEIPFQFGFCLKNLFLSNTYIKYCLKLVKILRFDKQIYNWNPFMSYWFWTTALKKREEWCKCRQFGQKLIDRLLLLKIIVFIRKRENFIYCCLTKKRKMADLTERQLCTVYRCHFGKGIVFSKAFSLKGIHICTKQTALQTYIHNLKFSIMRIKK